MLCHFGPGCELHFEMGHRINRRRVLVVEDNPSLRHLLAFRFRLAGFAVRTAPNGDVAWKIAQTVRFDVVVTDHQMPVMTGLELCERLRSTSSYADTPIIMITAKGFEFELPRFAKSLELFAIFPKPFSPLDVVHAVENSLEIPA